MLASPACAALDSGERMKVAGRVCIALGILLRLHISLAMTGRTRSNVRRTCFNGRRESLKQCLDANAGDSSDAQRGNGSSRQGDQGVAIWFGDFVKYRSASRLGRLCRGGFGGSLFFCFCFSLYLLILRRSLRLLICRICHSRYLRSVFAAIRLII
jgi:hypothetical protein